MCLFLLSRHSNTSASEIITIKCTSISLLENQYLKTYIEDFQAKEHQNFDEDIMDLLLKIHKKYSCPKKT